MAEELPKGSLQVASAEDQQMIQALPASCSHPSLGERVRLGCPDRRLDDLHAFGAEDLVVGRRISSLGPGSGIALLEGAPPLPGSEPAGSPTPSRGCWWRRGCAPFWTRARSQRVCTGCGARPSPP